MDAYSITLQLGGTFTGGHGNAPCPICQPERRADQNALSLTDAGDKLLAYCFKGNCSFAEIAKAINLPRQAFTNDPPAQRVAEEKQIKQQKKARDKARSLWKSADPITGTLADTYLRGRGITIPLPDGLRFLPDTYHAPSRKFVCAMIADVQPTGGIHRTYFTERGQRLPKSAKMMLGPCAGGAVRLSEGSGPLVVAEGIETALSVVQLLAERSPTVWAALSTSGIKGLHLPKTPGELILASDGDEPGLIAANTLAAHASIIGWNVFILKAPDGMDWNDVLRGRSAA